jgi:hypothetical protein
MAKTGQSIKIAKAWTDDLNSRRKINKNLYELYEGAIRHHVMKRINKEFTDPKNQSELSHRILEVDLVRRIVNKLSKAYSKSPNRKIIGTPADQELYDWYVETLDLNNAMKRADKAFNNYKEFLVYPYFSERSQLPAMKVIDPFKYIAISEDNDDDSVATTYAVLAGILENGKEKLYCADNQTFWVQDSDGEILTDELAKMGNTEGVNIYNAVPYIYGKNATATVMPYPDESMEGIATLIPLLCADINFAVKYMAFSIVYGINMKAETFNRSPAAFISLVKEDINDETKPELGQLKPEIDISEVFESIMNQLDLWLNMRGITGSIVKSKDISSGISKMIDEADVTDQISNNQVEYIKAEKQIFDFIKKAHEVWKGQNSEIPSGSFSLDCDLLIEFERVEPIRSRTDIVKEVAEEKAAGLTSTKRAVKRINPNLPDEEIDEILEEIEAEKKPSVAANKEDAAEDDTMEEEDSKKEDMKE